MLNLPGQVKGSQKLFHSIPFSLNELERNRIEFFLLVLIL